jgi:hypothetical protein
MTYEDVTPLISLEISAKTVMRVGERICEGIENFFEDYTYYSSLQDNPECWRLWFSCPTRQIL